MRKSPIHLLLLTVIIQLTGCRDSATLTVGAARISINPEPGAYIAGDRQGRTFSGILDSLYVKAVVISGDSEKIAFLTVDCIGLLKPEIDRIRTAVAGAMDIRPDHLIVSSTHTHAGPDVVGIWGPDYQHSGVDTAYITRLVNAAVIALVHADVQRTTASVHVGEGIYPGTWMANISDEELDKTLSVIQFRDGDGKSIATLTNFACHPTFLDRTFDVVSADYPSAFYSAMDEKLDGVNLFLQGAIGGWVQPENVPPGIESMNSSGRDLAAFTLTVLDSSREEHKPELAFRSREISLPVENENWKALSAGGIIKRQISDSVTTTISWASIGSAQFITHPGETTPWLSLESRKMMSTGPRFVLGLSQDALGYILKPEFFTDTTYRHSGYLTGMSLGAQTTPVLHKKLSELMGARP